ncbi:zf-CCHC domain-containing protein, partial [Tanacetum coccineum]
EEDPAEYPINGEDDEDDDDDDDDEEEEASEEDEEEEEHLALADSTYYLLISIRSQTPMAASAEALIAEYASVPTPPSPSSSPLTPLSSLLPRIPSPPLPLPSPPTHTSPIYDEAPLGYRATMIQDDLLKADMSIRKRARFTAPTGRFEVGASSSAAAARQTRQTLAHRVDYGFIDTKMIVSMPPRETHELQAADARRALAYSESRSQAMESQIRDLQRDVDVIQRQMVRDEDRLTSHIQHQHDSFRQLVRTEEAGPQDGPADAGSSFPPKRTTNPMSDAAIKELVARSVADALAEHEANRSRNGDDNHDSGTGSRRTERAARECTYSDFLKCQPLNFKDQVTLLGYALTWWNSHVKTVGHDSEYGMPWKTLKKMMTDKYCPRGEIKKLEIELWNLKVKESDEVEKYVGRLPDMIQGSVIASKPERLARVANPTDWLSLVTEEEEVETMAETIEQYMSKTRADYGSVVVRPKNKDNDNFELKGQFLKELRTNTFSDQVMLRAFPMSLTGAASRWLRNKPIRYELQLGRLDKFLSKYYPPARTAKKMEEINNFQQEPDENLYQAWERFKELLMKCPQYYLTEMQEVVLFYNGLDVPTRQILDSRGAIPSKTAADAKTAIQEMAEYSQKWHNGTSRVKSTETFDGLAAIQAQLNNLGREIKKVNEKVYAAQVGCYYQRNHANPSYQERRQSMEDTLRKFMGKSTKRHEENSNLIKEIRASTDAAIRNQGASIKTLEIQIGKMSKVLQERGFGSLPSSTEANLRDQVKSISTTIEADSYLIHRIRSSQYAVSTGQNRTLMYETKQMTIPFPSRLNGYYCEEKKGSYGP